MLLYQIIWNFKITDMRVITPTDLRRDTNKYFSLAQEERVIVKKGELYVELVVSDRIFENPSPSNDPYFAKRENIEAVKHAVQQEKEGKLTSLNKNERDNLLRI